jgi:hypothetical protein
VFAIVAHKFQEPGWPDRYVHHRYWHGWLEFKGEHTRLDKKQRIIIARLNERVPDSAFVVRWPDRIEDEEGELLATFNGTGHDLIEALKLLKENTT